MKILEVPKQKIVNNNISVIKVRAQFPQFRNVRIINLIFWGNLTRDIINYYKVNDYVLIEGYLSLPDKQTSDMINQSLKKIEITVLKIYPFILSSNRSESMF